MGKQNLVEKIKKVGGGAPLKSRKKRTSFILRKVFYTLNKPYTDPFPRKIQKGLNNKRGNLNSIFFFFFFLVKFKYRPPNQNFKKNNLRDFFKNKFSFKIFFPFNNRAPYQTGKILWEFFKSEKKPIRKKNFSNISFPKLIPAKGPQFFGKYF